MLLRGLGDDSISVDSGSSDTTTLSDPSAGVQTSYYPDTSAAPVLPSGAISQPSSSGSSSSTFSDIANGIAKVLPSLVAGAIVYKKATASPTIPYSYNPALSPYYGANGAIVYPQGTVGLTTPVAGSNTLMYVALGIAALFVVKGLRD